MATEAAVTKACQHPQLWFSSGDYYVRCHACLAQWGRLSNDGRPEYVEYAGKKIGCAPEAANHGFVADGKSRHI